jgi:Putative Flp pilus-assembly TadE/G-like
MIVPASRRRERGQVLPLFALFLVVLLGFAALAIDVSGAYAARRFYRSAADAAALAGAQDLQDIGSRVVSSGDKKNARHDAMAHLVAELGITGTLPLECATPTDPLSPDEDVPDTCVLPGTTFHVSIKTPVGACQDCDVTRSLQVSLRNAEYGLTFARVLGQSSWNVGVTSVAGLAFGRSYAVITLRPPKKVGSTFAVNDIELGGGTMVNVQHGDVGTNSNMDYAGSGTIMNIDSGYGMYYFDPFNGPTWVGAPIPPGQIVQKITTMIDVPIYNYPLMSGSRGTAPTFTDASPSSCQGAPGTPGANLACSRADLDPACLVEAGKLDPSPSHYAFMPAQLLNPNTIYCYNEGIYDTTSAKQLTVGTGNLGILKPGAYYLKSGLDVGGRLVGGYQEDSPGVALMFDETGPGNCSSCVFNGNNALTIALNAGTKFPPGTTGTAATAAIDWNNQLVQTSGPSSPTPHLMMTVLVLKDSACYVPTPPQQLIEPSGCNANKNKTLNIAGVGNLVLEGVQYMPTDNVEISGNSSANGQIGQIIAWTLKYSGGIKLNQQGPTSQGPGTLRLDAACTAPSSPCSP